MAISEHYPDPVRSHSASNSTNGAVIDIGSANHWPPQMIIKVENGTANYDVQCSHDGVSFFALLAGATVDRSVSLVLGFRFWRTVFNSGTGKITSTVGGVPRYDGTYAQMNLAITSTTNASL